MHPRANDRSPHRLHPPKPDAHAAARAAPAARLAKVDFLRAERLDGEDGGVEEGVDVEAVVAAGVKSR